MKTVKTIIATLILSLASLSAIAQNVTPSHEADGTSLYGSRQFILKFNPLTQETIVCRVVYRDGVDGDSYNLFIATNLPYEVRQDNKILFRLEDGEVIECRALRAYGEDDRYSAVNLQTVKYLNSYFNVSLEDMQKLISGKVIKMRVEFSSAYSDFEGNECKTIMKRIISAQKNVADYIAKNTTEF